MYNSWRKIGMSTADTSGCVVEVVSLSAVGPCGCVKVKTKETRQYKTDKLECGELNPLDTPLPDSVVENQMDTATMSKTVIGTECANDRKNSLPRKQSVKIDCSKNVVKEVGRDPPSKQKNVCPCKSTGNRNSASQQSDSAKNIRNSSGESERSGSHEVGRCKQTQTELKNSEPESNSNSNPKSTITSTASQTGEDHVETSSKDNTEHKDSLTGTPFELNPKIAVKERDVKNETVTPPSPGSHKTPENSNNDVPTKSSNSNANVPSEEVNEDKENNKNNNKSNTSIRDKLRSSWSSRFQKRTS